MNLIWASIAGFLSGVFGAMGLGGGGVLIIYLTGIIDTEQALAQGINLLFFIPCAVVAIVIHAKKKLINFKLALSLALVGLVGSAIGSYIACFLDNKVLSKIFAILLLSMSIIQFKKSSKQE